jgi:hypothetical protein
MSDVQSTARLAGQLEYLLDDRPELRSASVEQLVERIGHDDRSARAREAYQAESDWFVRDHLDEFPPRITRKMVVDALRRIGDPRA